MAPAVVVNKHRQKTRKVHAQPSHAKLKSSVAVLGATGSIGTAALDVINHLGHPWRAFGLSAHSQLDELEQLAISNEPSFVAATCPEKARHHTFTKLPKATKLLTGSESLIEIATHPQVDTVVAAVVGSAGLASTLAAAENGKRLALANKEALVVAGSLVSQSVKRGGAELIPVDSEHSAIFQAIQAGSPQEVGRIVLTASGGPFRTWSSREMEAATVAAALAHPTWQMGRKITIDSATMMNKGLEVIEARWLFDLQPDQIEVLVHPQSLVHSMVTFRDGSTKAQIGLPDMKIPIQYALSYPERWSAPHPRIDWSGVGSLEFEPPDPERFPCLPLSYEALRIGGSAPAVLNAANEEAVALFLSGQIRFTDIPRLVSIALERVDVEREPDVFGLFQVDEAARRLVQELSTASAY